MMFHCKKLMLWYPLEAPRGGFLISTTIFFLWRNERNINTFHCQFCLVEKSALQGATLNVQTDS